MDAATAILLSVLIFAAATTLITAMVTNQKLDVGLDVDFPEIGAHIGGKAKVGIGEVSKQKDGKRRSGQRKHGKQTRGK